MKCHSCKGESTKHTRYCLRCYIRDCVRKTLGVTTELEKEYYTNQLFTKLKNQHFTCVYTGRKLVPGKNMSLDHILPKSQFPELSLNLNNLVWVDTSCNVAKNNLLPEDFVKLCEDVIVTKSEILTSKVVTFSQLSV